jgi:hypothetical protein
MLRLRFGDALKDLYETFYKTEEYTIETPVSCKKQVL